MLLKLLFFLLGLVVGIVVISGFEGIINFLVGKACGAKLHSLKYLYLHITDCNGIRKYSKGSFSPVCQIYMIEKDQSDLLSLIQIIVYNVISGLFCVGFWIIFLKTFGNISQPDFLISFLGGLIIWHSFSVLMRFVIIIKIALEPKNNLRNLLNTKIKEIKNNVSLRDIDFPDVSTVENNSGTTVTANYQSLIFNKKILLDDFDGMEQIIASIEDCLELKKAEPSDSYVTANTGSYYDLLFYYSCIRPDRAKAEFIYSIIGTDLKNDTDSNGYRVLAYYTFYVLNDPASAKKYIDEGRKVLPLFPGGSLTECEEMLINRLDNIINEHCPSLRSE